MKVLIFLAVMVTVTLCQKVTTVDPSGGNSTDSGNSTSTVAPLTTTVNTTDSGNSTEPSKLTTVPPTNGTEPANSTTPAPTTPVSTKTPTTTPAPTTTPVPTPTVETVNATVKNSSVLCISMVAEMSLTFDSKRIVTVPSNAKIDGNCSLSDSTQSLDLEFDDNKLTFIFSLDDNNDVTISEIDITYGKEMKEENVTGSFLKSGSDGSYYLCNSNTTVANWKNVVLTATNLKYKAFNKDLSADFSKDATVTECAADEDTSSIVPIAVGAALAGLVIIVLIAYLIGRRRSRQTGYESV